VVSIVIEGAVDGFMVLELVEEAAAQASQC
jgi:hypothetical protein